MTAKPMMRFVAIDPRRASVELVDARELTDLYESVGINPGEVDHGSLYRFEDTGETLNIVVYEAGLFKGEQGRYFSIGFHLYEGGAIIYAADWKGDTVSVRHKPPIVFYRDAAEVERAIAAGDVIRPQRAFGTDVTWRWPEQRDYHMTQMETDMMIELLKREEK